MEKHGMSSNKNMVFFLKPIQLSNASNKATS